MRAQIMKEEGKGNKDKEEEGQEEEEEKGRTGIWTIMFQKRRKRRKSQLQLHQKKHSRNLGPSFGLFPILLYPHLNPLCGILNVGLKKSLTVQLMVVITQGLGYDAVKFHL